jgi:carbon monoxide dehydrogenase subunit G
VKIQNEYTFQATRTEVWDILLDSDALGASIPGCKSIELTGSDEYKILMSIGIAAVKGEYSGTAKISEKEEPRQYRMAVEGSGGPGFIKGDGMIRFGEKDADTTTVKYDFDVQIGGKIAGIGQRMISGISKIMADQFFKSMDKQLMIRKDAYQPGLLEKLWRRFRSFLQKLFGSSGGS